jgi:hypothetical protein
MIKEIDIVSQQVRVLSIIINDINTAPPQIIIVSTTHKVRILWLTIEGLTNVT